MWGAIAGLAMSVGGGIYNAISGAKQRKKIKNYLNGQERQATQDYNHEVGSTRARIQAALTSGKENMMQGISAAQDTAAVMGGSTYDTRAMKEKAVEQAAESGRQGAALAEQAEENAYRQRSQTLQNIAAQRVGLAQSTAQQTASMAGQVAQAGMSLATSDLQSHLDTGKGAFENALKNSDTTTKSDMGTGLNATGKASQAPLMDKINPEMKSYINRPLYDYYTA